MRGLFSQNGEIPICGAERETQSDTLVDESMLLDTWDGSMNVALRDFAVEI